MWQPGTVAPARLIRPMLATLGPLPTGAGWASEFKWDGVRTVLYCHGGAVSAISRNDLDVTTHYPEIWALTGMLAGRDAILDAELVALDEGGVPQFARLQNRIHVRAPGPAQLASTPVTAYLFDVLSLDSAPTVDTPYRRRREILESLALDSGAIRTPPSFADAEPADVYRTALDTGLEGVVCKRLASTYRPGTRSADWIKVPVAATQEVVLVGWQPGAGRRAGMIGSLLLAVHDCGTLAYAGKVGTGFTDAALHDLAARIAPFATDDPPVPDVPRPDARAARWLRPDLVGEVTFRNWTPDGRLRHPSWRGLRADKSPTEAVRPRD